MLEISDNWEIYPWIQFLVMIQYTQNRWQMNLCLSFNYFKNKSILMIFKQEQIERHIITQDLFQVAFANS